MKARILSWARVLLGASLAIWVVRSLGGGAPPLREIQGWVLAFAAFSVLGGSIEAQRLKLLLAAQEIHLPFPQGFRLVAVGTFFNFCIPGGTGGDLMKLYYLASQSRGRGVEAATIVLLDRALAMWTLLLFIVLMAAGSPGIISSDSTLATLVLLAGSGLAGLFAAGVLAFHHADRMARFLTGRAPRRFGIEFIVRALQALSHFRARTLLSAVGLTLLGHALLASLFASMAQLLLHAESFRASATQAALGMLANALPITPGGIGVGEAAFEQLFAIRGVAGGALLILAWRIGMLPLCLLGLAFYGRGVRLVGSRPPVQTAPSSSPGKDPDDA